MCASAQYIVVILEPPDAPSDLKITEHDGRSARVSWSPPYSGNSPIIHYLIQYKLDSGQCLSLE